MPAPKYQEAVPTADAERVLWQDLMTGILMVNFLRWVSVQQARPQTFAIFALWIRQNSLSGTNNLQLGLSSVSGPPVATTGDVPTQRWRDDVQCGIDYPLSDGSAAECNPHGENPCCGGMRFCGNTRHFCDCYFCTNYTRIYDELRETGGKQRWRYDRKCSVDYLLPDGTPPECNPDGEYPCCDGVECGNTAEHCICSDCVDYREVKQLRQFKESCGIIKTGTGFLKTARFYEKTNFVEYKCTYTEVYYRPNYNNSRLNNFTEVCANDTLLYQACGFYTKITNSEVLCGGYACEQKGEESKFIECTGDNCKAENRNCSATDITSGDNTNTLCNDQCDFTHCKDESFCNGHQYGVSCAWWEGDYVPVDRVCDGYEDCYDVADQLNCTVTNSTVHTCPHYWRKIVFGRETTVPILNYTRCSAFDIKKVGYPYCLNYLDQTNCSDPERVGGRCRVNGYWSTVSKYVVCYKYDQKKRRSVKICDDNSQNNCISPSNSSCEIHKHRMCDGVEDCFDGSDEKHDMCQVSTEEYGLTCTRRFQIQLGKYKIPLSWILDDEIDCIEGEDENNISNICRGEANKADDLNEHCQNVYKCPGAGKSLVQYDVFCNGVESCGHGGGENRVCRVARDFPSINTTASIITDTIRNVCNETLGNCKIREFKRPWGEVFGEPKIELYAHTSKVNCSKQFGEYYLYLSCMDVCEEANAICPLAEEKRRLEYNSCRGQFSDKAYTLGNNSFLTFVIKSENGHYHQNFFRCNNSRCVKYNQVCDLVDDCGDMSDELGCVNHMICEDTLTLTKHQFISLSQKCDGIYDCFDLSDECNDSCGRAILGNWVLRGVCWLMGIFALSFNMYTLIGGLSSLKNSQTSSMIISKVLISLIGSGDLLIGLYLVILSVYDSIIYRRNYCRNQPEWLTGTACLVLGVISTVGSQVSVFSMTVFSSIRLYGVRSMKIPGPLDKKALCKVTSLALTIIAASLTVALTPLLPFLEDYFVQGMYYSPSHKLFIGFPNRERHMDVLDSYYGNTTNKTLSWKEIGEKVDGMFSLERGSLTKTPVHFYGNDGVCLFKYFVRTDDARRSRQSFDTGVMVNDPVVWMMLMVNLGCFLIIAGCYIGIIKNTRLTSQTLGLRDNRNRVNQKRSMERRVMIIVLTDFLCWVPFIIISGLHNDGRIDSSTWYVSFAMIVLPLNSVINPIIYDRKLQEFILSKLTKVKGYISFRVSLIVGMTVGLLRRRNEDDEPEIIRLRELANIRDNNEIANDDA